MGQMCCHCHYCFPIFTLFLFSLSWFLFFCEIGRDQPGNSVGLDGIVRCVTFPWPWFVIVHWRAGGNYNFQAQIYPILQFSTSFHLLNIRPEYGHCIPSPKQTFKRFMITHWYDIGKYLLSVDHLSGSISDHLHINNPKGAKSEPAEMHKT